MTLKRIRDSVIRCTSPNCPISIDDVFSLMASEAEQQRRVRHTQLLVVLNNTDFASVDILRRMRPLSVSPNPDTSSPQGFVSASIGCI